MFFVYILRTDRNTLYVGQTNDLDRRLFEHMKKGKRGAKYLRQFNTFELVYKETVSTRSEALKREFYLKSLSKKQKELIIIGV